MRDARKAGAVPSWRRGRRGEGRGTAAPRAVRKIKFGEKGPHRECHIFITVAHFV